jgi:thiol-disulfide isomerase/thioredoxin
MRFRVFGAAAFLGFATLSPLAAQERSLLCLGGGRITDAELHQGNAIVILWASWSPRSRGIAERINAIARRWGGRARVIAVDFQEDEDEVAAFVAKSKMDVPVCLDLDGAFSRRYDLATLPGLLVLRNGEAVVHERLPDDPDRTIAAALDR